MYKNVFIDKNNEINENGLGRMVTVADLNFEVCKGNEPIKSLIQTTEGVVMWVDNTNNQESVEDIGEIMEYILISKEKNKLYESLMEDVNDRGLDIIKCNLGEYCLTTIVQDFKQEFVYMFNIWFGNEDEEPIIKNETMMDKDLLVYSLQLV